MSEPTKADVAAADELLRTALTPPGRNLAVIIARHMQPERSAAEAMAEAMLSACTSHCGCYSGKNPHYHHRDCWKNKVLAGLEAYKKSRGE